MEVNFPLEKTKPGLQAFFLLVSTRAFPKTKIQSQKPKPKTSENLTVVVEALRPF